MEKLDLSDGSKKSYLWKEVMKAATILFLESRAYSMSLQIGSAFLPFIVDLAFGKDLDYMRRVTA